MNHRERFVRTLTGKDVDRVPFIKVFGGTNAIVPRWEQEHEGLSSTIDSILQFEGVYRGWGTTPVNVSLSQRGAPTTMEDNSTRAVQRFADGMVVMRLKGCDYHHQTIEYPVRGLRDWERVKAIHLQADDPERFPSDWPERVKEYSTRTYPLQLTHGGVYGFARTIMGDEALLYAMYDAPDLVHAIMEHYTDMVLAIWSRMVRDVEFDLIEFWEDMASKNGCLISPDMFREFMLPQYTRVKAFTAKHGVSVILVDSDGYIDKLAALMLEAGVTSMYPFEVGAGCNIDDVRRRHPTIGIIGGLSKEAMIYGKAAIDKEMEKARHLISLGRLIPGPDHFVQSDVSWENYRYFMERLREMVMTTKPGSQHRSAGDA
jgi:uroporphyrinogen decarboxylase